MTSPVRFARESRHREARRPKPHASAGKATPAAAADFSELACEKTKASLVLSDPRRHGARFSFANDYRCVVKERSVGGVKHEIAKVCNAYATIVRAVEFGHGAGRGWARAAAPSTVRTGFRGSRRSARRSRWATSAEGSREVEQPGVAGGAGEIRASFRVRHVEHGER